MRAIVLVLVCGCGPSSVNGPPVCDAPVSSAAMVTVKQVATAPPSPAGGPPAQDGTFVATDRSIYTGKGGASGPTGESYAATMVVTGESYRLTVDESGAETNRSAGSFTLKGTSIAVTQSCPAADTGIYVAYDSDGAHFTLYTSPTAATVTALRFEKQ